MHLSEIIIEALSSVSFGRARPCSGVPVVERAFYFVGAGFLFLISLGRWRTRPWRPVKAARDLDLDPTVTRQRGVIYLCSDAAFFTGMAVVVVVLGIGSLAYWVWCSVAS